MYCVNGNSSWYSDCGPLFGGCPLLGVSVIGGSTVLYDWGVGSFIPITKYRWVCLFVFQMFTFS